jgi:hypothetical protein
MNITYAGFGLCALALIGCAHGSGAGGPAQAFDAFTCPSTGASEAEIAESQRRARGAALSLAAPVDHVRFVQHYPGAETDMFATRGAGCEESSEPQACEAKLAALEAEAQASTPECSERDCPPFVYAISLDRDQLTLHRSPDALLALLGTIDSPEEAWIMLMIHNGAPAHGCGDTESSGYRSVPSGFELMRRAYTSSCEPVERVETVDHVDRSGQIKRVGQTVLEHEPEECFRGRDGRGE